jgi:putative phage-type endonuclease
MEQRSPEWFAARLGKVTASRIADADAKIKTGYGQSRQDYLDELVFERINGIPAPKYQNAYMIDGIEIEPEARAAYVFYNNVDVVEVGFVPHPTIIMAGASPDGLVGADGLIEIKCPTWKIHQKTLLTKKIPVTYIKQMQFQMACTGRAWCDYVSYNKLWRPDMQIKIIRIARDDKLIAELEHTARALLAEVDATVDALHLSLEAA